jgi:esterase/lipase superfamily enzyme
MKAGPIFSKDSAKFIRSLALEHGIDHFHLLGHSIGCQLVFSTLEELENMGALRDARVGQGPEKEQSQTTTVPDTPPTPSVSIRNVILLNADYPLYDFQDVQVKFLRRKVRRTTVYADRKDLALMFAELSTLRWSLGRHTKGFGHVPEGGDGWIDVIDTTDMDQNVHSLRHSYFNLNMQIIGDMVELIRTEAPARQRHRTLVSSSPDQPIYSFLCPPSFINADRAQA